MLDKKFSPDSQTAFAARYEAQKIAFAPVVFQCLAYATKRGMLKALAEAGESGISIQNLADSGQWSLYALKLVLETCLSADLEASLDQGKPLGLKALGDWPTIYQGLSQLPEPAKRSWFEFDHHYSDTSFPSILPDVFASRPRRLMDIGANTGKFSRAALDYNSEVTLHLVDLPQQLAVAEQTLNEAGVRERAQLYPTDLLDPERPLPQGMDLIWMSQFLSCFSEEAISSILQRAVAALAPNGQLLILDTLWDRQRYDIAAYCLINTSPYFTAMASGNSKVYQSDDYIRLCRNAGLKLLTIRDEIGYCHSLLRFAKENP
jgi:hypothetical protein